MRDILFCASTYKSVSNAIRFANSIDYINGKHTCVLTGPIEKEMQEIANQTNAICFVSDTNSLYLGRAWGYIWSLFNTRSHKYLCSCDDDIEFIEDSKNIVYWLNRAYNKVGFSVMTFMSGAHAYKTHEKMVENFAVGVPWLNGDSMFSRTSDNFMHGLPDTLLDYPLSFFTEIEYQQRMRWWTGKPLVVCKGKDRYIHHFRKDKSLAGLRAEQTSTGSSMGLRLWKEKYDMEISKLSPAVISSTFAAVRKADPMEHMMFEDVLWFRIYDSLKGDYRRIYGRGLLRRSQRDS
jgi:hypothetical protein